MPTRSAPRKLTGCVLECNRLEGCADSKCLFDILGFAKLYVGPKNLLANQKNIYVLSK